MTRDWSADFALFDALYPGKDWRKMTPSVFLAYLKHADSISAYVHGFWTDDHERRRTVDKDNRKILIKRRFPTLFPEEADG